MIAAICPAAPGFDPALELLSLLSPIPAPLACLRADLGLRTVHELAPLRHDAADRLGVRIDLLRGEHESYVVRHGHARRAAELAGAYFSRVYGAGADDA